MKFSISIVDSYYPEALQAILGTLAPGEGSSVHRKQILDASFGTSDFVSQSLRAIGWHAEDVVSVTDRPYLLWDTREDKCFFGRELHVVFMQDLSLFSPERLAYLRERHLLVGQLSCPWPGDEAVAKFHVLFTSFPHYVPRIEALGVRAVFLKLAFAPIVWQRLNMIPEYLPGAWERPRPVTFVGGFGRHWHKGPLDFEVLAREVPEFRWWGYGIDYVPADCPALRAAYQGPAWGLDMYRIYAESQIVVNRHGEIAEGCGNNLRQYEATGMGAMLVTDCVGQGLHHNFKAGEECLVYPAGNGSALVDLVKHYLEFGDKRERIARRGHEATLQRHTYAERAKTLDAVLSAELARRMDAAT